MLLQLLYYKVYTIFIFAVLYSSQKPLRHWMSDLYMEKHTRAMKNAWTRATKIEQKLTNYSRVNEAKNQKKKN